MRSISGVAVTDDGTVFVTGFLRPDPEAEPPRNRHEAAIWIIAESRRDSGPMVTGNSLLGDPVGIAVSGDGKQVYVADSFGTLVAFFWNSTAEEWVVAIKDEAPTGFPAGVSLSSDEQNLYWTNQDPFAGPERGPGEGTGIARIGLIEDEYEFWDDPAFVFPTGVSERRGDWYALDRATGIYSYVAAE
jgi:DNA-binding beta-propeller fold protein YncE